MIIEPSKPLLTEFATSAEYTYVPTPIPVLAAVIVFAAAVNLIALPAVVAFAVTNSATSGQPRVGQPNLYPNTVGMGDNTQQQPNQAQAKGKGA